MEPLGTLVLVCVKSPGQWYSAWFWALLESRLRGATWSLDLKSLIGSLSPQESPRVAGVSWCWDVLDPGFAEVFLKPPGQTWTTQCGVSQEHGFMGTWQEPGSMEGGWCCGGVLGAPLGHGSWQVLEWFRGLSLWEPLRNLGQRKLTWSCRGHLWLLSYVALLELDSTHVGWKFEFAGAFWEPGTNKATPSHGSCQGPLEPAGTGLSLEPGFAAGVWCCGSCLRPLESAGARWDRVLGSWEPAGRLGLLQ